MVFLLLLDVVASTSLYIIFRCGTWVLYTSANGLYYIYEKIKPTRSLSIENNNSDNTLNNENNENNREDDDDCVILTREEYDKLIELK
jgi:hypothetical protein